MAPACRRSSFLPGDHHVFIITPPPTLSSLHSPLIFLCYPQFSLLYLLISTCLSPLSPLMLPKHSNLITSLQPNTFLCSLIQTFLCCLPLLSLSLFVSLHFLHLPLRLPSLCSVLLYLLTVSRAPVLNSLSKALTSGSIVRPLIKRGHLPSAHFRANTIHHWAPLFCQSPHDSLMVQKCRIGRLFCVKSYRRKAAVTGCTSFKKPSGFIVLTCSKDMFLIFSW